MSKYMHIILVKIGRNLEKTSKYDPTLTEIDPTLTEIVHRQIVNLGQDVSEVWQKKIATCRFC